MIQLPHERVADKAQSRAGESVERGDARERVERAARRHPARARLPAARQPHRACVARVGRARRGRVGVSSGRGARRGLLVGPAVTREEERRDDCEELEEELHRLPATRNATWRQPRGRVRFRVVRVHHVTPVMCDASDGLDIPGTSKL